CIRGGLVNLPAIYGTVGATNQCETVTSTPNPQQVLSPYHRPAFNSWTSPTVTYSCASPDGTAFTETVTGSYIGAVATDGDPSIGWTLDPTRGGISTVFDGVCGAAAGGTGASTAPTTGLCHVGVPSTITLDTTNNLFTWSCAAGSGGGTPAACQTPYSPSGCSPATVANGTVGSSPTCTVTCDSGYALSADGKSCTASCPAPYTMECHVTGFDDGSNGGKSTTCQCSNAYCGTAQGEASGTAPSSNLCLNGSTPTVSVNAGNWTWSCGFKQQCNAPVLCNPSSVANGTVNADCSITCDSGYNLSGDGKSCSAADPVGCCSSCPDYGTSIGCIYFPSTLSNCPTINTNGWIGEMWGPQNCGPVCNPASVANGTVNPVDCSINCNSGYALSSDGQSCNASPAPDGCVSVCGDFYSDGQTWCEPSGFGYICVNGRKMSDGQLSCKKGWAC
ncbi:hypothetical protein, partial [Paludibacterium sp.]|uniref:hypothetical protein n=1 Tax=Paludibacterium sp. TaxID=1917523 RepID=UPI0025FAB7F9